MIALLTTPCKGIIVENKIEQLSDKALDLAIADIILGASTDKDIQRLLQSGKLSYTKNWGDLMPHVVEKRISYADRNDGRKGRFLAQYSFQNDHKPPYHEDNSNWTYIESVNDDLQRALAECLLKVIAK